MGLKVFFKLFRITIGEMGNVNVPLTDILGIKWGDNFKTAVTCIVVLDMTLVGEYDNTYVFEDASSSIGQGGKITLCKNGVTDIRLKFLAHCGAYKVETHNRSNILRRFRLIMTHIYEC